MYDPGVRFFEPICGGLLDEQHAGLYSCSRRGKRANTLAKANIKRV